MPQCRTFFSRTIVTKSQTNRILEQLDLLTCAQKLFNIQMMTRPLCAIYALSVCQNSFDLTKTNRIFVKNLNTSEETPTLEDVLDSFKYSSAATIVSYVYNVDGGVNRWCTLVTRKTHPRMSPAVPSGRREGMFPGRYSEIFGLGERLGCILNFDYSFDAIETYL